MRILGLVSNICNIAVPLFFMISGFLFFKEGYLTSELYKSKIHKRIKTILVPYLIWNVIICLFYFFVQNIAPSMNSGRNKLIADYSVQDFFMMFWSMSYIKEGGMNGPMDTPLWFIRDLMVMMLASPFVYIMIKKANGLLPFFALAFYISGIWVGVPGFSSVALAFFSLGAFFAIKKWNFVIISRKCFIYILPLYAVLLIALVLANDFTIEIPTYAKHLLVLIGVFMCVGTASVVVEKKWICINSFLAGSTFFIFVSHCELLKVFIRLVSRTGVQNDLYYCLMYFICPMLTLVLLLFIYKVLQKYVPSLTELLSGGR